MVTTRSQKSRKKQYSTIVSKVPNPQKRDDAFKINTKISANRPTTLPQPPGLPFQLQPAIFGMIQERIQSSLYALVVQAILWNQTTGLTARPVLFQILSSYPTPLDLSRAELKTLTSFLQPIGLQNIRAARLIALAEAWIRALPSAERRYRKLHYPSRGSGMDVKPGEVLEIDDEREGWEIAHLPGMGPYALDSFRIFYRDRLRGIGANGEIPEWQRVLPKDKDLKAYLRWKWAQAGWNWDANTGNCIKIMEAV
ncbi:DNA glycosylase [Dendryphion nanum]|uniref:DNA glycosylase n=1 Tax=Dendryphion nanum TaxID=256645 RepID=A0A9P9EEW0_9PLEO|nr:DNA glycosylase [Dendryphion nanum]